MITNDVLLHEDNKAPALTCNIVLAKESQMPRPLSVISRYAAVCGILAMFSTAASADTWKIQLAVINTAGEVYARDLTADETVYPPHLTATTVGPPQKLDGPSLFGGPDDAFVLGSTNKISVVTTSGVLWTHRI